MSKLIIVIGLITVMLSVGLLAGCDRVPIGEGSGNKITKDFNYTGFTGIEIEDAFEVEVTYADTYSVTITAGENVMKRVDVSQSGDTLKIELDDWWWFWHATPKATITLPALRRLEISGASKGDVRGFRSNEDLTLELSGASELDIDMEAGEFYADISGASKLTGDLQTADAEIELSGASEVKLAGSGDNLNLNSSGASTTHLSVFTVDDADIELSGASHGEANIAGTLDVTLSGASSLKYYGNPDLGRVNVSGASTLEEAD